MQSQSDLLRGIDAFFDRHDCSNGLYLDDNQIGDAGVTALAEAVGKGTLPQLKRLDLSGNGTISQQAKDALKAALPNCEMYF